MQYFSSLEIVDTLSKNIFPVGAKHKNIDNTTDTLFYDVGIFGAESSIASYSSGIYVASLRVRRVLVSKMFNEGRSIEYSMGQIDQLEYDICSKVWSDKKGYKFIDAMIGDLLIFEEVTFASKVSLHDFNINRILDDVRAYIGEAGLVLYVEDYGVKFTEFNKNACVYIPGVGYALPGTLCGLSTKRKKKYVPELTW